MKNGVEYFSLDCVLDLKLKLIHAEYGFEGRSMIIALYQKIYGSEGYYCKWDEEIAMLFAMENGLKYDRVLDVVRAAVKRGIFDEKLYEEYNILTSNGIQKRYFDVTKLRRELVVDKRYLIGEHYRKNPNVAFTDAVGASKTVAAPKQEQRLSADSGTKPESRSEQRSETGTYRKQARERKCDPACDAPAKPLAEILRETARVLSEGKGAEPISEQVQAEAADEETTESVPQEEFSPDPPNYTFKTLATGGELYRLTRSHKLYGKYFNVILNDLQYADLCERIPNADEYIERLSLRMCDKSFKCSDPYAAIIDCYEREMARRKASLGENGK